jgi:hypothetical protein
MAEVKKVGPVPSAVQGGLSLVSTFLLEISVSILLFIFKTLEPKLLYLIK